MCVATPEDEMGNEERGTQLSRFPCSERTLTCSTSNASPSDVISITARIDLQGRERTSNAK
jgi:hypothetical protein